MKKILSILILVVFLCGCSNGEENLEGIMNLRKAVISAKSCSFSAIITADYQTESFMFKMDCVSDEQGNVTFTVIEPTSVSGITGKVSNDGGKLTFDDKYLVFAPLADGLITPVSAPWLFMKTLRSGYISGCSVTENGDSILFNDTYQNNSMDMIIQTNENNLPCLAEIYWQGRCAVTIRVENFTFS